MTGSIEYSDSTKAVENPNPQRLPEGENAQPLETIGATASEKLIIIMVGLPATGKTHMASRICRFLEFFHDIPSKIFNVGDYRRKMVGAKMPASFYDHSNPEAVAKRSEACNAALEDMVSFMKKDGVRVGLYDATNSTQERRKHLKDRIAKCCKGSKVFFIESICDDGEMLEKNIRSVKLSTPDYKDMDPEEARKDFLARRQQYDHVYQTLNDNDGPHIKVFNCKKFVVNNIRGYLPLKVVHFLMNLHTLPRTFYLTRHGQSDYNLLGKIGGDSSLTEAGLEYARRLAVFAREVVAQGESDEVERPCRLWTSTLKRTKETAQFIEHNTIDTVYDNGDKVDWVQFRPMERRNLDELYAGICDGMTYKEIAAAMPSEFERRQKDKLAYRYPRGESYMDVTLRLEPLAHELERAREPILIIGHQGILRIIYAYFLGLKREDAPYVNIPLNTIIQLSPHAYSCEENRTILMNKNEMFVDGQDEPVTSMPDARKTPATLSCSPSFSDGDPVMNAPSC